MYCPHKSYFVTSEYKNSFRKALLRVTRDVVKLKYLILYLCSLQYRYMLPAT